MNYLLEISCRGQVTGKVSLHSKNIIGRGSKVDIEIKEDGISRSHLLIEIVKREDVFITDLGSSNGTFIAEQRIEPNKRQEFTTFFMPIWLGQNVSLLIIQEAY